MSITDPLDKLSKIEFIKSLLKVLTEEERHVIVQVYYKQRRYVDICRDDIFRWKITKGRISQIRNTAIQKLQLESINRCFDLGFNNIENEIKKNIKSDDK